MKLGALAGIVAGFTAALPIGEQQGTVARDARTLVNREDIGTLSTVFQSGSLKGDPTGQMEYYADCYEDGTLTLIGMNISTAFTNINEGSKASFHIRQHPYHNRYRFPGGIPKSPAGSPRITLTGSAEPLDNVTEEEQERLARCFLAVHPDAKWWLPGSDAVHDSFWVKFVPEKIHYIGGFGDRAFIGDIPVEEYQESAPDRKGFKHQEKKKKRDLGEKKKRKKRDLDLTKEEASALRNNLRVHGGRMPRPLEKRDRKLRIKGSFN
ncbi:hypothetical protein TRVA0_032S00210 [Trichomonascus vanleenenianus]|uniref:CREG family protein n=1 Tax=Trichomonascus vanleenenianus TaxID=2268995 RepID=UPI003ECB7863